MLTSRSPPPPPTPPTSATRPSWGRALGLHRGGRCAPGRPVGPLLHPVRHGAVHIPPQLLDAPLDFRLDLVHCGLTGSQSLPGAGTPTRQVFPTLRRQSACLHHVF